MDFYYDITKKIKGEVVSQESIMDYEFDTYDVLGSTFLRRIPTLTPSAEDLIIENGCRFDNISYKHTNTVSYWWIIMEFNSYIDWGIKEGDKYKIPKLTDINKLVQRLIVKKNALKIK